MWVPGHFGIRANAAEDRAAKEALDEKPTADLMPFPDLKHLTARYVYQMWQKEEMIRFQYLTSFTKFYQNLQTACCLFVIHK